MREIKFRGIPIKKEDRDKFGYEVGKPIDKFIYGDLEIDYNYGGGTKYYISKEIFGYLAYRERIEVDPNTVGQFTGLHDKNGVEIYEGDVVQERGLRETWTLSRRDEFSERKHVIMWDEEQLEWIGNILEEYLMKIWDRRDLGFLNEKYTLEVIGNIHNNEVGE